MKAAAKIKFMKKSIFKYVSLVIALLLLISGMPDVHKNTLPIIVSANRKYVSLYDLNATFPVETTYDLILQRGKLYHESHVAVYKAGHAYMLIDGRLCRDEYPVIRLKGDILIPVFLAGNLISSFYPSVELKEKGRAFAIQKRTYKKSEISKKTDKAARKPAEPISFIIIDPGHGGKDPGAICPFRRIKGGLQEKKITLKIALRVEKMLKKKVSHIPIYLTRRSDRFIELSRRTDIANSKLRKNKNGVFVSIHVNASVSSRVTGFETFFLSQNPSNEDARNTAALENNVIVLENGKHKKRKYGDIEYIEARMITTQIQIESSMLANCIQHSLASGIKKSKSLGVKKADFFVLRGSLMPAVLVEVGFITNTSESSRLKTSRYQKLLASRIAEGIVKFIGKYNRTIK